jgi:hypothetical protein
MGILASSAADCTPGTDRLPRADSSQRLSCQDALSSRMGSRGVRGESSLGRSAAPPTRYQQERARGGCGGGCEAIFLCGPPSSAARGWPASTEPRRGRRGSKGRGSGQAPDCGEGPSAAPRGASRGRGAVSPLLAHPEGVACTSEGCVGPPAVSPLWSSRGDLLVRAAVIGGPWMARERRAPPRTAGEQGAGIARGN